MLLGRIKSEFVRILDYELKYTIIIEGSVCKFNPFTQLFINDDHKILLII